MLQYACTQQWSNDLSDNAITIQLTCREKCFISPLPHTRASSQHSAQSVSLIVNWNFPTLKSAGFESSILRGCYWYSRTRASGRGWTTGYDCIPWSTGGLRGVYKFMRGKGRLNAQSLLPSTGQCRTREHSFKAIGERYMKWAARGFSSDTSSHIGKYYNNI